MSKYIYSISDMDNFEKEKRLVRKTHDNMGAASLRDEQYLINYKANRMNEKPSQRDYNETLTILADFGLKKKRVPKFDTYKDLLNWRKKTIFDYLNV